MSLQFKFYISQVLCNGYGALIFPEAETILRATESFDSIRYTRDKIVQQDHVNCNLNLVLKFSGEQIHLDTNR